MVEELVLAAASDRTNAVVKVGHGRGFVVENTVARKGYTKRELLIVTAAHCIAFETPISQSELKPFTPMPARFSEEVTYRKLIGPLKGKRTIAAECRFCDLVADLAVLGPPDNQTFGDEADAYEDFVEKAGVLSIADVPGESMPGSLLSLAGDWYECTVGHNGGALWVSGKGGTLGRPPAKIAGGMSGSPILRADGAAIGVVSVDHGPNPRLAYHLPVWMWKAAAEMKEATATFVAVGEARSTPIDVAYYSRACIASFDDPQLVALRAKMTFEEIVAALALCRSGRAFDVDELDAYATSIQP